jgi:uncharacterized protein (TIGR03643 family)
MELVLSGNSGTRRQGVTVSNPVKRTDSQTSAIIRLAWEDRTTFEEIEKKTGLSEAEVIKVMRRELKPSSFRLWRKRVNGRITKHRKRFEKEILRRSQDGFTR